MRKIVVTVISITIQYITYSTQLNNKTQNTNHKNYIFKKNTEGISTLLVSLFIFGATLRHMKNMKTYSDPIKNAGHFSACILSLAVSKTLFEHGLSKMFIKNEYQKKNNSI